MRLAINLERNFERRCLSAVDPVFPRMPILAAPKAISARAKMPSQGLAARQHRMMWGTRLTLKNVGHCLRFDRHIAERRPARLAQEALDNAAGVFKCLQRLAPRN